MLCWLVERCGTSTEYYRTLVERCGSLELTFCMSFCGECHVESEMHHPMPRTIWRLQQGSRGPGTGARISCNAAHNVLGKTIPCISHNPRGLDPDPSRCCCSTVFASYPEIEIEGTILVLYTRYAFVEAELSAPSDSDTAPRAMKAANCISAGPVIETIVGRHDFLNTNKQHTLCNCMRFRSGRGFAADSIYSKMLDNCFAK